MSSRDSSESASSRSSNACPSSSETFTGCLNSRLRTEATKASTSATTASTFDPVTVVVGRDPAVVDVVGSPARPLLAGLPTMLRPTRATARRTSTARPSPAITRFKGS
jgi:hypothetical protein